MNILSLGLYFEDNNYKMFIEGVIGSFDFEWMPDLEISVNQALDSFISDHKELTGEYPNETYMKLNMKQESEFHDCTKATDIFFTEISRESHDYL